MKFKLKSSDPFKLETDVLIVFCREKGIEGLHTFPEGLKQLIRTAAKHELFVGKQGEIITLTSGAIIGAYKTMLVGLGEKKELNAEHILSVVAAAVRKARKEYKPSVITLFPDEEWQKMISPAAISELLVVGTRLAAYQFTKYKGEEERKKSRSIEEVMICVPPAKLAMAEEGMSRGIQVSTAALFARDLVNEPAHVTTPLFLATCAQSLEKTSKGKIRVSVWEKEHVEKLGMDAFLGVARGSEEALKFIRLEYKGSRVKQKIVLAGKGITFDTGGLSLKGAEHMETMKLDMAGAAAVLGIFSALPQLNLPIHVVGLIASCENMPSGKALKPGDIVRAYNGKTIEVLNTDAEGRLTLADVLSYAVEKEKPSIIIDLATLTGACMVALGEDIAGLWSNNDKLTEAFETASRAEGEKLWHMPLEKSYGELNKSTIADLKNIQTGRYAGAITAALFLSEFVGDVPWVHLDIAGPAYAEKDSPLTPIGGTGYGVRLLLRYLSSL